MLQYVSFLYFIWTRFRLFCINRKDGKIDTQQLFVFITKLFLTFGDTHGGVKTWVETEKFREGGVFFPKPSFQFFQWKKWKFEGVLEKTFYEILLL